MHARLVTSLMTKEAQKSTLNTANDERTHKVVDVALNKKMESFKVINIPATPIRRYKGLGTRLSSESIHTIA